MTARNLIIMAREAADNALRALDASDALQMPGARDYAIRRTTNALNDAEHYIIEARAALRANGG